MFLEVHQVNCPAAQMFFLNDTIKKVDATLKLMKIDTNDVNLHKSCNLIQIGTAAKLHCAN